MRQAAPVAPSIRRHLLAGVLILIVLLGGVAAWAVTTDISGAVIAPGKVVVDTNIKRVQHLSGGIVSELLVREGDRVDEGDVVIRLDATLTLTNLAIVNKGLNELLARKARLEAERDGSASVAMPAELTSLIDNGEVARIIEGEQRLFEIRRQARTGEQQQLSQRIAQLKEELTGHASQAEAKTHEISLIQRELKGVRGLWDKKLMSMTKLTALEREAARLKGEHGLLVATQAQVKGKVSEIELQIVQVDRDLASEVARELRDVDAKIGELVER
ncbi:MAG TPA: biotin/lipoyl-binding protein, partial [Hyphomicrobium sp.]|nr:biotin/lipoyl-binding protein [Hyphomicrobium sp.]